MGLGTRRQHELYLESLSDLLNKSLSQSDVQHTRITQEIADSLRAIKWIEPLIENDLCLYAQLEAALGAGGC